MFSLCIIRSKMTALESHMYKMCLVAEESPQANRKQESEMCLFSFMLANSLGASTGALLHDVLFWNVKAIFCYCSLLKTLFLYFCCCLAMGFLFIKQNLMWLALRPLWWCMCKICSWKKTNQGIYVVWLVWKKEMSNSPLVSPWGCLHDTVNPSMVISRLLELMHIWESQEFCVKVTVKYLVRFVIPASLMNRSFLQQQHVIEMKASLSSPSSLHALIDKARLCSSREMSLLTVWV